MFFQAIDCRFKRFCTVLKIRIRLEGSRLEGSKTRKMKKAFSKVSHAKVKEFFTFSELGNLVNLAKSVLSYLFINWLPGPY